MSIDKKRLEKIKWVKPDSENQYMDIRLSKRIRIIILFVFLFASAGCIWKIMSDMTDFINIHKMCVALVVLSASACVDLREHRIPNLFPFLLFFFGTLFLGIGWITGQNGAMSYIYSSLFATVVCGLFMTVAYLLSRKGIGLGDIKLICGIAVLCGAYTVGSTLFWGLLVCAFVSIVILLTKKMDKKGTLPFAPFLLLGYWVTIISSFY